MKDSELPDFSSDEVCEQPERLKSSDTATETIDAQQLWPIGTSSSGSFKLTGTKESSFGKLLNALPTPALVINVRTEITFANDALKDMTGNAEDLPGCRFVDCLKPENPSSMESLIEKVLTDRKSRVVETLLKTDVKNIWGRVHFRPIRFGTEQGLLVIVEDLTPEKLQLALEQRHRDELEKSQEQLEKRVQERTKELLLANAQLREEIKQRIRVEQTLLKEKEFSGLALDSMPGIFYFCDEHGAVLRWNKNLEKALGYSSEEISHKNLLDFFSDPHRAVVERGIQRILLEGEHSGETEITCKDGRTIPYLINGVRISVNGRRCFVGTGIDISVRRQTEQALRDSEKRMRLVIEASPIGIGIVQDGMYIYANLALAENFGYDDPRHLVGLSTQDLFPDLDADSPDTPTREPLSRAASSHVVETKGRKRNGDSFDASIWVTAIKFRGKPSLLEYVIDLSTEKVLRERLVQAQKLEAIGTLAGGIAHDFNNLLTVIQGFAELVLLEQKEGDRRHEDLQQIIRAARNGADLVGRILTFSRNVKPELRPIDLNQEVRQAEKLLQRTIPKMIEIELRLEEPLAEINGDPGQLEQILLNLAVNARHAMPDGGKLVIATKNVVLDQRYCRARIDTKPGPHVLLSVTDTGVGMSAEVLDHVFEPFFTTKKPGEGTGLGLSMVFGIVRSHGGTITCRSQPNAGTTFEICFPANTATIHVAETTSEPRPTYGTETILLVDDEEPIRDLGTRMLSRAGYQVITASDGSEALYIYHGNRGAISLVLLDVIMPGMSGVQCLEKLLAIDPQVKILVTSGFDLDGYTRRIVEEKSKGFVSKPFKISHVLTVIRDVLDDSAR